ncbi:lantibiotic dehydratase C-terminal domain-containing protein [Nonomuraea rubra]|uniref:lantibiotic dehydratase C-terminal domain-containing protein n=1 Tax=Nonomuraea rubra TaxID=46180 RepID=UPI0033FBC527
MTTPHTHTTTTAEPRLPGVGAVPGDTEARLSATTRSDAAEERWISAHLFHFGDLDPLITAVVDPVTRELTADGTARTAFFLRYWEGGQHVRLRLEVPDPARQPHVRALIRERAAAHFAEHPSPPVDPAAYRAFAATMARGERRPNYDDRLHPPGSVAFIGYRPEHEAYGDAACVAAAERHFAVSSRLALHVLRAGTEPARRTAIGLAALTIAIAACEPDQQAAAHRLATAIREPSAPPSPGTSAPPSPGTMSSAIPSGPASPGAATWTRSAMEEDWRRHETALLAQTRTLWDAPSTGLLAAWASSIRALRADLDALHAEGRCTPADSGSPHAFLALAAPPEHRTVSLIVMRCVHLFHNRLGLRAGAEQHTSFLAARAVAGLADPRRWSP